MWISSENKQKTQFTFYLKATQWLMLMERTFMRWRSRKMIQSALASWPADSRYLYKLKDIVSFVHHEKKIKQAEKLEGGRGEMRVSGEKRSFFL